MNASMKEGRVCKFCGWPVIYALCNDGMSTVEPYAGNDWWIYCSNKTCEKHPGEAHNPGDVPDFIENTSETKPAVLNLKALTLNEPTRTGKLYSTEEIRKAISKVKLPLLGEFGFPKNSDLSSITCIDLNNVSHRVEELSISEDNSGLMVKVKILDTPKGKLFLENIEEMTVRPRMLTHLYKSPDGHKQAKDITIISFDAVSLDIAS